MYAGAIKDKESMTMSRNGMKSTLILMLALILCCTMMLQPVGAAAEGTSVTYQAILDGLGDALHYGVVADRYKQEGHAETSAAIDHLERGSGDPYMTSGRAQTAAAAYDIITDVTILGAHDAIDDMEFAVFKKAGSSFVRVSDIVSARTGAIAASSDTTKATVISGLRFRVESKEDKNVGLYVMQVENGTFVANGTMNTDNLIVQYGDSAIVDPTPATAAEANNYLGDIDLRDGGQNSLNLMQGAGQMYSSGYNITFGKGIYLYEKRGNSYVKVDMNTTHSVDEIYISQENWNPDKYNDLYKKFPNVKYVYENGEGTFTYYDEPIVFTFDGEKDVAKKLLRSAETVSKDLANANIGGKVVTPMGQRPTGGSNGSVSGPADSEGRVVTVYQLDVVEGRVSLNSVNDAYTEWTDKGVPISDNEYIVFNVVCPSKNGEVSTCALALRPENGALNKPGNWGEGDNVSALSRVIWNYVYEENGEYKPFEGTINYDGSAGGTLLAPKARVTVNSVADSAAFIVREIQNNGVELHQQLFDTDRSQEARVFMWPTGGVTFRKVGKAYTEYVKNADGTYTSRTVTPALSDAEFIIYTDKNDPEGSTVVTVRSNKDRTITATYQTWGYGGWTTHTMDITLDGGFVVAEGLPTFTVDPSSIEVKPDGTIVWPDKITYYIKEVKAPEGYALPANNDPLASFELRSGQTIDLSSTLITKVTENRDIGWGQSAQISYNALQNDLVYLPLSITKAVNGNAPAGEEFELDIRFVVKNLNAVSSAPVTTGAGPWGGVTITDVDYYWQATYDIDGGPAKTMTFYNTKGTREFYNQTVITLKKGQTINIHNLPACTYTVTETLKDGQAYVVSYDGNEKGTLKIDADPAVTTITNDYAYGALKLKKTVVNNDGQPITGTDEVFTVRVSVDPTLPEASYIQQDNGFDTEYTVNGVKKTAHFTLNGSRFEATITISNKDEVLFPSLPTGKYSVREELTEEQQPIYTVSYLKADGTITSTDTPSTSITNRMVKFKAGVQVKKQMQFGEDASSRTWQQGLTFQIYDRFGHLMDLDMTTDENGVAKALGLPLDCDWNGMPSGNTTFYLAETGDAAEGTQLEGAQQYMLGTGEDQIIIYGVQFTINGQNQQYDDDGYLLLNGQRAYVEANNGQPLLNKLQVSHLVLSKTLVGTSDTGTFDMKVEVTPSSSSALVTHEYRVATYTQVDWSGTPTDASYTAVTPTVENGKLVFTVSVPSGKLVSIENLPVGTFTVTEVGGTVNGSAVSIGSFDVTSKSTYRTTTKTGTTRVSGELLPAEGQ